MRQFWLLSLIIAIVLTSPVACLDANNNQNDPLRIYEVLPTGQSEGFALINFSANDVDLMGYVISDGEGTVTFTSSLIVGSMRTITILKGEPYEWYHVDDFVIIGSNGIIQKSFQLNDDGDEVILKNSRGVVVDVFVYGQGTASEGWNGDGFQKIPKNSFARRTSAFDTDSAKDWAVIVPGRTSLGTDEFNATVTPFVFPDSLGLPVMNALVNAEREVLISIYILDHGEIVSILMNLLKKGVSVRILLEGSPAGGVPDNEIGYMATLCREGADVLIMKNADGFRRYSYLHNKYAVIDSETVIITSENWRHSSFTGNRGWGAIISSEGYAEYMRTVFMGDIDSSYGDVLPFMSVYSGANSSYVYEYAHTQTDFQSYPATVSPMITPDFAFERLTELMDSADVRIYSEQLSADITWTSGDSPLMQMLSASKNGLDVRLIVDVTFDSPYDNDINDGYWVRDKMRDLGLMILTSDDSSFNGLIHNKGVVVDDIAWVGSMNWNNSSFGNNREVGVMISSKAVSDVYAAAFLSDWGIYAEDTLLNVSVTYVNGNVVLDASSSMIPPGAVIEWDLDSDGINDRTGTKIIVTLPTGQRDCVLSVSDGIGGVHTYNFVLDVPGVESDESPQPYLKYIPVLAICIIVIAFRYILVRRNNDRT